MAHTTYRLSEKFSIEHIEKLMLLFDVFEGINGNRNDSENSSFIEVLKSLTPAKIYNLSIKHKITPYSSNSWLKGITAGTDDHSGLFVGTTYTELRTNSLDDVIPSIRRKTSEPAGNSRNHKGFAFEIFKGAYDNFNSKGGNPEELVNQISAHVLKESSFSLKNRYKLHRMRKSKIRLYRLLSDIITESDKSYPSIDDKLNHLYSHIVGLSDEITSDFFNALFDSFYKGNLGGTLKVIPRTFASSLIYIPAMFALKYMNKDRDFHSEVHNHFVNAAVRKKHKKKILWFTDTINDLNGVAVTLRNIGWLSHKRGDDLHIVSSVLDSEDTSLLPPNLINLKPLVDFKLPYYEKLTVKVPSCAGDA